MNIHDSVVSEDGALKATLAAFDYKTGEIRGNPGGNPGTGNPEEIRGQTERSPVFLGHKADAHLRSVAQRFLRPAALPWSQRTQ